MFSIPILFQKAPQKLGINQCLLKYIHICLKPKFCFFIWHFYFCSFSQKETTAAKYRYPRHCPGRVLNYSSFCRVGGSRKVQFCFVFFFFSGHVCFSWKEMLQTFKPCYSRTKRDVRVNLFMDVELRLGVGRVSPVRQWFGSTVSCKSCCLMRWA